MPRSPDTVKVEVIGASGQNGVLDNFTSLEIVQDIGSPMEANFELGNDGTFTSIENLIAPGAEYRVIVNGRSILRGRIELNDVPLDAGSGSVVRFTVRTKLSDAFFASADQRIRIKDTTLERFIARVYEPLGYSFPDDFVLRADLDRDLRTGKRSEGRGAAVDVKLKNLKIPEARVKPPESIYAAADRHLRRFGLMHWDGADGKIVIGFPDEAQPPTYIFNALRNNNRRSSNNIIGVTRTQDFSNVPTTIGVFGTGGKRDFSRAKVRGFAADLDALDAGFHRPVTIIAEGIKNKEAAANAALRELAQRLRQKDSFPIELDGLSHWSGDDQTPYAIDTVAGINTDVSGGNAGAYYVHRVAMRRDAASGDTTSLSTVKRGAFKLFPDAFEGRLSA